MNCAELSHHTLDYLDGSLDPRRSAELADHLAGCDACRRQLAELRETWIALGALPQEEPGAHLRESFYREHQRTLAAEHRAAPARMLLDRLGDWFLPSGRGLGIQTAAALLLLAGGVAIGTQLGQRATPERDGVESLRDEVRSLTELVTLSLLQQDSASERLKGVRYGATAAVHDDQVLSALLDALGHDPSVNVRLAAIDALQPYATRAPVRSSMLVSLRRESSPVVQVALVDALVHGDGRETRATLEDLANDSTVDAAVREHVRTLLEESA